MDSRSSLASARSVAVPTLCCAAILVLSSCGGAGDRPKSSASTGSGCDTPKPLGEARDLDLARCLAGAPSPAKKQSVEHSVTLYLDHSASMQGFLDPKYATHVPTDFRSVIDKLIVGLKPAKAFAYGVALQQVQPDLGTVGKKSFYSDRDTRMEDALSLIAKDTGSVSTHVLVGDGRRGGPDAANSQYSRMRAVAEEWIGRGGTFAVAASMAPFTTVESDPSGCRQGADATTDSLRQTCPLYAFAFIAPGDELRILGTLASVSEHLYAWPVPAIDRSALTVEASGSSPALTVQPTWAMSRDGSSIARSRGPSATNNAVSAQVRVRDSTTFNGRTFDKLLTGEGTQLQLFAKSMDAAAEGHEWLPIAGGGAVIRVSTEKPLTVVLVTRGQAAARSIVRLDLVTTGEPSWLSEFDAGDAKDVIRTFGLGRLFEPFRQEARKSTPRFGHMFFVVN